jgi:hypothetical protein
VVPEFRLLCENVFAPNANVMCPDKGQLTWVTLCGLPDTTPATCSAIDGLQDSLAVVSLRKVDYAGPLEQYGNPPADGFGAKVENLQPGNVILVQSLASLYVMRLISISAEGLTYDWAMIWRDTCWRPGGPRCMASCSCPGGN